MELAIRGSNLDVWPLGCFCFDKAAKALIKRPLDMALIKWLGPAADKLIARDTMELAIRGSNLDVWPLGCFCLDKTAKALIKRPLDLALTKRPLGALLMTH